MGIKKMNVDMNLLKCSLVLGVLFFVLSHPFLYKSLHRHFGHIVSFVDERMCPTESGVIIHAIIFGLVVYFGKKMYEENYGNKKVKNNKNNNSNNSNNSNNKLLKKKCRVYCEKI